MLSPPLRSFSQSTLSNPVYLSFSSFYFFPFFLSLLFLLTSSDLFIYVSIFIQEKSTSSVLASPVPVATVTTVSIVSNDQFNSLDVPFANELAGNAVSVEPVELSHYHFEEVLQSVEQIADPTIPLRDVPNSHVKILATSTHSIAFAYRNRMIAVKSSADCSPTILRSKM